MNILQGMDNIASQGYYNALGLREIGEYAQFYVFHDTIFKQGYDHNLNIRKSKVLLYPYYIIKLVLFFAFSCLRFDCFHFHFGKSILPGNLDLPILKILKKKVFMEYHGGDIRWQLTSEKGERELRIEKQADKRKKQEIHRVFKYSDCLILHDSELKSFLVDYTGDLAYVPLRVDVGSFIPAYPDPNKKKPVIVHAPSKRSEKGTEFVLQAIEELKSKYEFDFVLIEKMTHEEAKKAYASADIIIDQLRAGTYGVLSVEGMASGKPVICYIMESMKKEFPDDLPIVQATKNDVKEKIENLILDGPLRNRLGVDGRKYAERYHNYKADAELLREIYRGNCRNESQRQAFKRVREYSETQKESYKSE